MSQEAGAEIGPCASQDALLPLVTTAVNNKKTKGIEANPVLKEVELREI